MRIDKAVMTLKNYVESKEKTPSASVREAAEDYVKACEGINNELIRLEELLNKNLRSEAIQYANIEPRIEDQVASLDFSGRGDFEMIAPFQDLPTAPPLKIDVIGNLQSAYAEYQVLAHQYRNLRKLVLQRAPIADRLLVMREIAMVDRINAVLIEDVGVIEKQIQVELLKRIRKAEKNDDINGMFAANEEFKSQNWINPPDPKIIEEIDKIIKKFRSAYISRQLNALSNQGMSYVRASDFQNAKTSLAKWKDLARSFGVQEGDQYWSRAEPLIRAIQDYIDRINTTETINMLLIFFRKALADAVPDSNSNRTIAELEKMFTQLSNSGAKIPKDMMDLFDKRIEELSASRKSQELLILASLFAGGIVLLLAFLIWMIARSR